MSLPLLQSRNIYCHPTTSVCLSRDGIHRGMSTVICQTWRCPALAMRQLSNRRYCISPRQRKLLQWHNSQYEHTVFPLNHPISSTSSRHWRCGNPPSKLIYFHFLATICHLTVARRFYFQISEMSGLPVTSVEIAKGKGEFPGRVSALEANTVGLDWNPSSSSNKLISHPLFIDHGYVIFYRYVCTQSLQLYCDMVWHSVMTEL